MWFVWRVSRRWPYAAVFKHLETDGLQKIHALQRRMRRSEHNRPLIYNALIGGPAAGPQF